MDPYVLQLQFPDTPLTYYSNELITKEGNEVVVTLDIDGKETPVLILINKGKWEGNGMIVVPTKCNIKK